MLSLPNFEALAQVPPPDAASQELRRQQERERALREQLEAAPDVRLERPQTPPTERLAQDEAPCFPIQTLILDGEAAERFQWVLAAAERAEDGSADSPIGRCLGAQGINLLLRRMQNAAIARGYVTSRILAQPQDLTTGTLRVTVVPGRIREIRLSGEAEPRAQLANALPTRPGALLDLRDIEQGLENLKRVPTAEADIQIVPAEGDGAAPGESDLVIAWRQARLLRVSASVDDSGTEATGKYQGALTLSGDHLLRLNDLFYASYNHDLGGGEPERYGTRGYVLHYSLPLGYWQLGATVSSNRYYQAVAGLDQTYTYSGQSRNADVVLSRVVYRDAVRRSTLSLRGWTRAARNFIDDTEVEVQRRDTAGWELGAAHREFIDSATLEANLVYRRGTGAIRSRAAPEEDFGEGTSRPEFLTAELQLNLPFQLAGAGLRYLGSLRGQWNRTPLVPQDRFSIGGRYSVRGFDGESQLTGDRGWLSRNEIGLALGDSGQELYAGIDYGSVGGQSSRLLVGTSLSGAVLGLRGGYRGLAYDLFAGRPLGKPDLLDTADMVTGFTLSWSY